MVGCISSPVYHGLFLVPLGARQATDASVFCYQGQRFDGFPLERASAMETAPSYSQILINRHAFQNPPSGGDDCRDGFSSVLTFQNCHASMILLFSRGHSAGQRAGADRWRVAQESFFPPSDVACCPTIQALTATEE